MTDNTSPKNESEPFINMPIDAAVDAAASESKPVNETDLTPCPKCQTLLEPFQVTCHKCGRLSDTNSVPTITVEEAVQQAAELEEAYSDWLAKGTNALGDERYGEAQACFIEALARSRPLSNHVAREIEVRKQLAKALERLDKKREASEQYILLSQLNRRLQTRQADDEFTKRARQLSLSTMDILSAVDKNAAFRPPAGGEFKLVPLYCAQCKRLLLEAEIYSVRKGKATRVRCFCGFDGVPLVRSDAKHVRALKTATAVRQRKSQLIQAASDQLPQGRQKQTAILLAVLAGVFGAHKFYLGEKVPGAIYLILCWTGIPALIGWFEAINYYQMSRVTFNLMYNIEEVIKRLPEEEPEPASTDHSDVFSMEITAPEPEEMIDQFTTTETQR